MIHKVEDYIKSKDLKGKKVLVAVSGGPDSIFLLYILWKLKEKYSLILRAAYVNHGIRSNFENNKDLELISNLCNKLGIVLCVKTISQGSIKESLNNMDGSIESIARDIRYRYFYSIADKDEFIAIAHNRDDQIETQIMRFFQGSITGLRGIKQERDMIIRPILGIDKNEIINYLNNNKINYNIDKTNNENEYLRNRIRNILVPEIKSIFPGYKQGLNNIRDDINLLLGSIKQNKLNWDNNEDLFSVEYDRFLELSVFEKRTEIYRLFNKCYTGGTISFRLPKRFLLPLGKTSFKKNKIILDGYGFRLLRDGNRIIWGSIKQTPKYRLKIEKNCQFFNGIKKLIFSNQRGNTLLPCIDYPFFITNDIQKWSNKNEIKNYLSMDNCTIIEQEGDLLYIISNSKIIYSNSNRDKKGVFYSEI